MNRRGRWAADCARTIAVFFAIAPRLCGQTPKPLEYRPTSQIGGTIRVCGSPQMGDMLKLYEAGFARLQPGVRFENDLESTTTAVAGVAAGKAEIGLLGREIWPEEQRAFAAVRGHPPLVVDIATGSYDVPKATFALMVFVPAMNPIASLSIGQLERIFAQYNGGGDGPVHTWGELGLKGEWTNRPVHLYGFAAENDKSRIFARLAFPNNEQWSPALKQFSNAGDVDAGELIVQAVASDPDGIGISNVHYATAAVRAVAISAAGDPPVLPTRANVASRRYPLTRAVYMVADADARRPLSPAVAQFLRYVLSSQGQLDVVHEGNYLALPAKVAAAEANRLRRPGKNAP